MNIFREHRLINATLRKNVEERKKARLAGVPIVNAQPVAIPATQKVQTGTIRGGPAVKVVKPYRPLETNPTLPDAPLPQEDKGFDLRGAGNPVYTTADQLTEAYNSQGTRQAILDEQLAKNEISQDDYNREISQMFDESQYKMSLEKIKQFGTGVDPLGFGNKTIQNRGSYETIDEAKAAAQEEYTRTGTISPETQAAIDSFANPVVYEGATYRPRNQTQNSLQYAEDSRKQALNLAKQDVATRAKNAGIDEKSQLLYSLINSGKLGGMGTFNGRVSFTAVTPEVMRSLNEAGVKFQVENTGDKDANAAGKRNIILLDGEEQFLKNKQAYDDISSGKDIEAVLGKVGDSTKAAVDAAGKGGVGTADTTPDAPIPSRATPEIEQTIASLKGMNAASMGVSQEVFNAFAPSINSLLTSAEKKRTQAEEIDTYEERAAIAEATIAPEKALALRREQQLIQRNAKDEALLKENQDILVEANRLTTEALDLDKKIFQEQARISEVRQMAANVDGEKRLRRSLNALGIENSPNATEYLQGKIQEAADTLQSMITTNSLTVLKFGNARMQLNNDLRSVLNEFDSKRATLNANFDENIFALDQFVSGARSAVLKELKEDWEKLLEQEDTLMMEAGNKIERMTMESIRIDREEKTDMINKEDKALQRINYLLSNYPRESVAGEIKKLGESVTSFNVQSLIDNPTLVEIKRSEEALAKRSKELKVGKTSGGGYSKTFIPPALQETIIPEITYEAFTNMKLVDIEQKELQSIGPKRRAEIIMENEKAWNKEYKAVYLSGPIGESANNVRTSLVQQFGQPVVDAANLVIDGTYGGTNAIKNAAKAFSVSESQIATAVAKLKMTGEVSDAAILSPQAQKSRDTIIDRVKTDPFYTVWNGAKSAATRIEVAIGNNGGADGLSDIMAINAFQNGIVDPGATVREGDVTLMQTAIAWSDLVNLEYWKEKISDGDKLPQSMRQKMLQLATSTRDSYALDFQNQTVPKVKALIKQNGLPSNVLDEYISISTNVSTVSPEVKKFRETYFPQ